MSALAMILTATFVVSDGAQAKQSAETRQVKLDSKLDLRGEWDLDIVGYIQARPFSCKELHESLRIRDDGGGKIRMAMPKFYNNGDLVFVPYTGTYRQEKDRVIIHFHMVTEKTPAALRDNIPQGCLILNRIKAHK